MKKSSRKYRWRERLLNNQVRLDQYPVDGDWSPKLWRNYHRYQKRGEVAIIKFIKRK